MPPMTFFFTHRSKLRILAVLSLRDCSTLRAANYALSIAFGHRIYSPRTQFLIQLLNYPLPNLIVVLFTLKEVYCNTENQRTILRAEGTRITPAIGSHRPYCIRYTDGLKLPRHMKEN